MKNMLRRINCMMIAFALVLSCAPLNTAWAVDGASEVVEEEAADTAASFENEGDIKDGEIAVNEESKETDTDSDSENKDVDDEQFYTKGMKTQAVSSVISVDGEIAHGDVSIDGLNGTAIPESDYDLATVRQIWTDENGNNQEKYLEYTKTAECYEFTAEDLECDSEITAFFFSLEVWDGAVDLTWYDPDDTVFEIGTPAELAGLAAITNGMVDDNVTAEYMIKDNEGRTIEEGKYKHAYLSTESWLVDLLSPNSTSGDSGHEASQVRDIAWRLPEVVKDNKIAADDVHNDFLYRTVKLTADIDMSGANWTPIGGKYSMNLEATKGEEAMVVDTRFQGVLEGQGHTVKLNCDRFSPLGFPYAMEIALVGYLGGGIDYENGYPKDTCMDYAKPWVPTVRDVVVKGNVNGRRMVAGIVGRMGETNYGVVVENCANYATITASDMRGCAGIVGAAWGKGTIRNCFNTGTIQSGFWEHGGIVGSNGYEGSGSRVPCGVSIYNCYNVGDSGIYAGNNKYEYDGQEIGVDGNANAEYEVANCYYIEPETAIEDKTGYSIGYNNKNKNVKIRNVQGLEDSYIKKDEFVNRLNGNGRVFKRDDNNINNGYPILYYQDGSQQEGTASITIDSAGTTNGSITFEGKSETTISDVSYGGVVNLTPKANPGYRLSKYVVTSDDNEDAYEITSGNFVIATGKNVTVKGIFEEVSKTELIFNEENEEGKLYFVNVEKVEVWDGNEHVKLDTPVVIKSGELLDYKDRIRISAVMKPWGDKNPDDNNTEYTGALGDPFEDVSFKKVSGTNNTYEITGEKDTANIQFKPKTQGKRWTTIADTSWYSEGIKEYVITTTRQLAGVARLCLDRTTDFDGVTIKLGNDISLANTKENGGNGYEISWLGIGTVRTPFKGTFDGQGHTIRHIHRNFKIGYCGMANGTYGGLFGATKNATIRNVTVESGTYINTDGEKESEYVCGFINGAIGGAIVGTATDTIIENCTASVPMNGGQDGLNGGIAGEIEGKTVIRNCVSNCRIKSSGESAGGIVAKLGACEGAMIEKCTNNGEITSTKWKVGGILGSGDSNAAIISTCINNGSISTSMRGTSSAAHAIGGVAGYSTGLLTINNCVNKGKLNGYQQTYAMGGIAGTLTRGTITDSANLGAIHSESTSKWAQLAGIANVGTNRYTKATVKNSYNAGRITLGDGFVSTSVGGVAGYGSAANNSFFKAVCTDKSVSAIGSKAGIAGQVVSEKLFKEKPASVLGDNFAPDKNNINGGLPVLAWQDPSAVASVSLSSVKKGGDTSINIKWSALGPRNGFELQRSINGGNYKTVYNGTALNFYDKGLKTGDTYSYRVRGYRNVEGTYHSKWSNVMTMKLLLAPMKLKSVKNNKKKTVTVKWKSVKNAVSYELYRSTSPSNGFKKIKTIKVSKKNKKKKTLSYTNKKLKKKKTYYYKIRYIKNIGGKKIYSEDSAVKKVKIKK